MYSPPPPPPITRMFYRTQKIPLPLFLLTLAQEIIPLTDMRNKQIFLGTYEQFQYEHNGNAGQF